MSSATALHDLAAAFGIDTEFHDWQGAHQQVADETLRAVLARLRRRRHRRRGLPPRAGRADRGPRVPDPPVPRGAARRGGRRDPHPGRTATLVLEDGTPRPVGIVDGRAQVPDDLPAGYHELQSEDASCRLIVAPREVPLPGSLAERPGWGLAIQLYSVRSTRSWGIGDLGDLAELAQWAGREHAADYLLVNPLHAAEVVAPMQPSPYLPTSRRFANPLYLRIEDVAEYADLPGDARGELQQRAAAARDANAELIGRDATWAAKRHALVALHAVRRTAAREDAFRAYCRREGAALDAFATWCALTEQYGTDSSTWPEALRDPRSRAVTEFAERHAGSVDLHRWMQWLLDDQLAAAQRTALEAGMRLGVVHDLAVGVSPTGADAWSYRHELATGITVGAPPDAYSQTGQDWNQPPWRPDRLAESGYEPVRELVAAALRHGGGLRVDHVIGLFRLWWIPRGAAAREGTYVHYDHDALIGILMIEAQRAGAVLIGEDLGNVEPWVRDYLAERGVFGTSILWFETEGDAPRPPQQWRRLCLASVTTHDLPPSLGYLAGDHVRLRDELGLLTRDVDEELAHDRADRQRWVDWLVDAGLLADGASDDETVLALHRALGRTPSLLRCAALTDAVGDRRTQNQPGTDQTQYANWRQPLRGPDGVPLLLEQVVTDPRAAQLAEVMRTDR